MKPWFASLRDDALVAARWWLGHLEPCDCPPETYPTGDTITHHEPFCSTILWAVASQLVAYDEAIDEALDYMRSGDSIAAQLCLSEASNSQGTPES